MSGHEDPEYQEEESGKSGIHQPEPAGASQGARTAEEFEQTGEAEESQHTVNARVTAR